MPCKYHHEQKSFIKRCRKQPVTDYRTRGGLASRANRGSGGNRIPTDNNARAVRVNDTGHRLIRRRGGETTTSQGDAAGAAPRRHRRHGFFGGPLFSTPCSEIRTRAVLAVIKIKRIVISREYVVAYAVYCCS